MEAQDFVDTIGFGSGDDDGDVLQFVIDLQVLVDLPTVHIGHHQVEQDEVRLGFARGFQTFTSSHGANQFEVLVSEDETDKFDHIGVIFDADDCEFFLYRC